ncbi:hypothetical protein V5O48_009061 [Marasmius crinis-equi]|uniref:Uncharacterized protein n=1 Tax=Marasmius crinis-equi TaxID=585013 RepID=A0ABR3FC58_9AGAR
MGSLLFGRFPIGEYTPPGHRKRWQIASDISSRKVEIWSIEMELWCEAIRRDEYEAVGDEAGRALAVQAIGQLQERLAEFTLSCRAFELELQQNNAARRKVYHYFAPRRTREREMADSSTAVDHRQEPSGPEIVNVLYGMELTPELLDALEAKPEPLDASEA